MASARPSCGRRKTVTRRDAFPRHDHRLGLARRQPHPALVMGRFRQPSTPRKATRSASPTWTTTARTSLSKSASSSTTTAPSSSTSPRSVHGDRFHVTDIDPDRPGLENFIIQQNNGTGLATAHLRRRHRRHDQEMVCRRRGGRGPRRGRRFRSRREGLRVFLHSAGHFRLQGQQTALHQPALPAGNDLVGRRPRARVRFHHRQLRHQPRHRQVQHRDRRRSSRVISLYSDPAAPDSPYNNYIAYGGGPQFWGDILGDWREELLCVGVPTTPSCASTR